MTRRYKHQSFALLLLLILIFTHGHAARAANSCQGVDFAIDANAPGGYTPQDVGTGDFNRDGKMDVVSLDIAPLSLIVRFGNGQGRMEGFSSTILSGSIDLSGLAIGDFNGDGNLDVATGSYHANMITIAFGDGTGSFPETAHIAAGDTGNSIVGGGTADLNGDGRNDLVVVYRDSNVIRILSETWNGRLVYSPPYAVGSSPRSVATGDFNGDGKIDIAVANHDSGDVSILYGTNGSGGFSPVVNYSVTYSPYGIVAADFNHDGKTDVAVASDNYVSVRLSNGTGFDAPVPYAAHANDNPKVITVADVNGDGQSDIVSVRGVGFGSLGGFSILRGDGTGRFDSALYLLRGNRSVASADFTGDGRSDLVTLDFRVELLTSKCAPPSHKIDYDGDNKTDIAVWRPSDGNWYIFNSGYETLRVEHWGLGSLGDVPAPADYDGDGKTDIAVFRSSAGAWYIHRSSDNAVQIQTFGSPGDKPVQGDYDGDMKADIAVWRPASGVWYILNSSDGTVRAQQWGRGDLSDQPAQGDFDNDGKTDLAVVRSNQSHWYILNSSNGAMFDLVWGVNGDVPLVFTTGGKSQIAMWRKLNNSWYVYQGVISTIQGIGEMPVPGDYDGDNLDDAVLWRSATGAWSIRSTGQLEEHAFQFGSAGDIPVSVPYHLQ
jgi:hypothetical protein